MQICMGLTILNNGYRVMQRRIKRICPCYRAEKGKIVRVLTRFYHNMKNIMDMKAFCVREGKEEAGLSTQEKE